MKTVKDVMTHDVKLIQPHQTLREAATLMGKADVGSLPVSENDRLVGMITDRDMVLRGIGAGLGVDTPIREVMTSSIKYCIEDEAVDDVARKMAELGVRRLPVLNRDKRLVGIIALSNIAQSGNQHASESLLDGVAQPH